MFKSELHLHCVCVVPVPLKDSAALGRARLQELAPTEAPVRKQAPSPGRTAGPSSVLRLRGFLPTLSWSPGLLEVTPAAPTPPHEGQLDLGWGGSGGVVSVLQHRHGLLPCGLQLLGMQTNS